MFPVKDTPGQTTISHFRLSSLTYLPAVFPISLLCTRARAILPNDIGHVLRQGFYPSCFLVQSQFTGARILITPPSYFCLHRKCEGFWSYSYFIFRSEDSWAWVANPAGVFGCRPALLEHNGDVHGSVTRDCDPWR